MKSVFPWIRAQICYNEDDEPGLDVILKCYSGKELISCPAAALDVLANVS